MIDAAAWMKPGERLDDLRRDGMYILQRPDGFCFGMDAVLLVAFAAPLAQGLCADLGTGSGVLPLLICARAPKAEFDAVEIQPDMADMAARSTAMNGLEARIRVHAMDLRDAPGRLGHGRYRLVVCNPPYGPADGAMQNPNVARRTARHEGTADVAAICAAAAGLLCTGGRLCVIYPAPRLLVLMDAMRDARIEPKRIRLIHPHWDTAPNLALMEGVRLGKPSLHFLPPLYIRDADGRETDALRRLYEG